MDGGEFCREDRYHRMTKGREDDGSLVATVQLGGVGRESWEWGDCS
jgi:hypothetical protein